MRLIYIQGTGHIISGDKDTPYPVNKLVLFNEKTGNNIEVKLDKLNKKLLPALFNLSDTGTKFHDENGVECSIWEFQE